MKEVGEEGKRGKEKRGRERELSHSLSHFPLLSLSSFFFLWLFVCLSVCLFSLSLYLYIYIHAYLSSLSISHLSVSHLSISHLSISHISLSLSPPLSHLSISLSLFSLFLSFSFFLSLSLSLCVSVSLSIYLTIYLTIYLSLSLYLCLLMIVPPSGLESGHKLPKTPLARRDQLSGPQKSGQKPPHNHLQNPSPFCMALRKSSGQILAKPGGLEGFWGGVSRKKFWTNSGFVQNVCPAKKFWKDPWGGVSRKKIL